MAQASLGRSSAIMALGSFASRILGQVRLALMTGAIGTLAAGNAFGLANTLPNVFYMLAAGGVINAVLIPALAKAMKLPDGGQEFTDRIITVSVVGMALVTVAITALAVPLVWLLAGDQPQSYRDLAIAFSLVCIPQVFFYGLHALLGQILNVRGKFGAFAWSPFIANVVAIIGLVVFMLMFEQPTCPSDGRGVPGCPPRGPGGGPPLHRPWYDSEWTGPMIWVFAGTATVSVMAQALTLLVALRGSGFHYRPRWGIRGVGLGAVTKLGMWAFWGLLISQVGFFVTQKVFNNREALAHQLHDEAFRGYYTYGNIAFPIFMLPHAFITVSIVTALYPRLAAAAAENDRTALVADFRRGLGLLLVGLVPAMVFMVVAAPAMVDFVQPAADPRAAQVASLVLSTMALGIIPFGLDLLCYRTLFALDDGRSTVIQAAALLAVGLVAAGIALMSPPVYAAGILALAQTLGNAVSAAIGIVRIRRHVGSLGLLEVAGTAARLGIAAVAGGVLGWAVVTAVSPMVGLDEHRGVVATMVGSGLVLALTAALLLGTYLGLTHVMNVRQVRDLTAMVRARLGR